MIPVAQIVHFSHGGTASTVWLVSFSTVSKKLPALHFISVLILRDKLQCYLSPRFPFCVNLNGLSQKGK